ncbi:MAG: hypothetical protein QS98_C0010G0073 [archaeon GW2011_AR3]|nr:MAG: hypothetical protein QS98_C0010G0073 [archaeon GW2011_AR3]MBS3110213.1 hypothetical protein [Candidatus Woesearchaeota archaeon]
MADNIPPSLQSMQAAPVAMPQSQAPESGGLFKHGGTVDLGPVYGEMNNISVRLRIAEERYTNLRKKTQLIEQNMLAGHRNANLEIKTTNADLNEIKRELADIKSKLNLMAGEFRTFAKRDDVKVVERYVNLWSPLNFVTAAEVEKIVRRLLDKDLSAENADDAKKR